LHILLLENIFLQARSPTPIVLSSGTDEEEAKRKQKKEEERAKDRRKSSQPIPKDPVFKTPDHTSDSDYEKSDSEDDFVDDSKKSKKVTHHVQKAHFGTVYKV